METYHYININLLKCNQCEKNFKLYDQPKSLCCGNIVCKQCEIEIKTSSLNDKFNCKSCLKYHNIPEEGFSFSELAINLLMSSPIQLSRGKEYYNAKSNLKKLDTLIKDLEKAQSNRDLIIDLHCTEQRRQVEDSWESKMWEIDKLHTIHLKKIDDYENECKKNVLSILKPNVITKNMNDSINFVTDKLKYLERLHIEESEFENIELKFKDLTTKLEQEIRNCNSLTYGNKLMEYNSEGSDSIIGSFYYTRILNVYLIIIILLQINLIKFFFKGFID